MDQTLTYYEQHADVFTAGSISADMEETRTHFLGALPKGAYLLDFGCGSGRDTKVFLDQGYQVDACDGSEELCRRASEYARTPVTHMLFHDLSAISQYDGIWACASILHLNKEDLKDVLRKISVALKPGGVLYTSFKYGTFEGMRGGRYFTDFNEEQLGVFMEQIPELKVFETWITNDVRPGKEEEQWINILARCMWRRLY